MFKIKIENLLNSDDEGKFYFGHLILEGDIEHLACSNRRWKTIQYRRQWTLALKRLLARGEITSAFVVSVGRGKSPSINWWIAKRNGSIVTFHEQWVNHATFRRRWFPRPTPEKAHESVPIRLFLNKPNVSKWLVKIGDIRKFVADPAIFH